MISTPGKLARARRLRTSLAILAASAGVVISGSGVAQAVPAGIGPIYPVASADNFYHQVGNIDSYKNGDVIASRPQPAPAGFLGASALLIKFRSTNSLGKPVAATGLLLKPANQAPDAPLLSYQHIINGLGTACAVSSALYSNDPDLQIREAPALNAVLQRGWAVMLTDHLGPNSAYGAAKMGGQVTLDGIRAAQRVPGGNLSKSPVGLIGYSGGGMATGYAAALAPSYAPELNIVGAAPGGVPMNMLKMAQGLGLNPHPAFGLAFAVAIGMEREYPDLPLGANLNHVGLQMRDRMANGCTNVILSAGAGKSAKDVSGATGLIQQLLDGNTTDPLVKRARAVMEDNSLEFYKGVPKAPVYLWHATKDVLIPLDSVQATAGRWCKAGAKVQNVKISPILPGENAETHLTAAVVGMPDTINYIADRFAGKPAPSNC